VISVFRKLKWLVQRRRKEDELREELQFHIDEEAEERQQAYGLDEEKARWAARRDLGNVTLLKEDTRTMWGWTMLVQLGQDARYSFRTMALNRMFTLLAVASLALGIGSATAIFSVVNAVLLRPMPYRASARLVAVSSLYQKGGTFRTYPTVSLDRVEDWRRLSGSLEAIGSFVFSAFPVSIGDHSMYLVGIGADQELLTTLGVGLELGQNFSNSGSSHKDPSVIISHRLWTEAFHSDPAAIGHGLMLDGDLYTVTGVLPATFQVPRSDASYFAEDPDLVFPVANIADGWGRNTAQWFAIARLKDGVSLAQAESELKTLTSRMAKQDELSVRLSPLNAETTATVRSPLLLLLGVSIVLLLIACTNIMNLLFSRASARGREMAIRRAAGATSLRLIRQMLTESACLTALGGILGVLLAWSVTGLLVSIAPAHLPVTGSVDIDPTVLGFTLILCAGAALSAGLLPALLTSRQRGNVAGSLGNRALGGRTLARFQQSLTVAQVALGLGLLAVAGLLAQSLLRLSSVNPGFRTEGVIGFELSIPSNRSSTAKQLIQRMLEETKSIPGVLSAGWITNLPPETRQGMFLQFSIVGPAAQASRTRPRCNFQATSEDYFQTVGVPLVRGRDLANGDAIGAPRVVIVNETFARQFFGSADPLGQSIVSVFDSKDAPRQIVGIIRDMHDRGLNANPVATAYIPYGQWVQGYGSIAVRTDLQPEAIIPEIRRRMTRIEPTVPLKNFTTIGARIHKSLGEPRFYALLAGSCGLMAVLFVTLGLYGVVSYSVSRRTAEIGVRMALGAPSQKILSGVLWQGLWMAALGVAIGLPVSLAASRVLKNLLFEVKPNDPATLGLAAGLVLMVTLAASYIPARRASRVDPMVALRHE
jgi:putative ABC transport system permease protein